MPHRTDKTIYDFIVKCDLIQYCIIQYNIIDKYIIDTIK